MQRQDGPHRDERWDPQGHPQAGWLASRVHRTQLVSDLGLSHRERTQSLWGEAQERNQKKAGVSFQRLSGDGGGGTDTDTFVLQSSIYKLSEKGYLGGARGAVTNAVPQSFIRS